MKDSDIHPWKVKYVAGGIECHPGKHYTNDRTAVVTWLLRRRRDLIAKRQHLKSMEISVSLCNEEGKMKVM